MLIRKEHTEKGGLLGIWEMEETSEELLNYFPPTLRGEAIEYLSGIRSHRRSIEWLSTRAMLFVLLGSEKSIHNNPNGSPYLADYSHNISISHTKDYAAILLHNSLPVGIDIETRSERIKKIADKFISDNEYIDPSQKIIHQLLHWSAKESMFKLLNLEAIDFKQHLHIHPFTPAQSGTITTTETKTEHARSYLLNYEIHEKYVLTWVIGHSKTI